MRFASMAIFLLGATLFACGGSSSENSAETGRQFRSLGTAPPGGAFFVVGGAISEVLNEFGDRQGWEFTAEATKGSQENIRRLAGGELDFALSNSAITYFALRGEGGWEKPYTMRNVMTLAPNVAFFITPQGSGVKQIADLKGRRVVIGPEGAGFENFVGPILAAHGVRFEDFTPLYRTQAGAVDMLADGSAAAAFLGGAVPTSSIAQACATQDIFFVPFGVEARRQLIQEYPFFDVATVPAGVYRGHDQDFECLEVGAMHLITRADQDEDLVYRVTKTLYENRQKVVEKHPAGRSINPANVIRDSGTAFHPGAIRYYREIGVWKEARSSEPDTAGGNSPSSR